MSSFPGPAHEIPTSSFVEYHFNALGRAGDARGLTEHMDEVLRHMHNFSRVCEQTLTRARAAQFALQNHKENMRTKLSDAMIRDKTNTDASRSMDEYFELSSKFSTPARQEVKWADTDFENNTTMILWLEPTAEELNKALNSLEVSARNLTRLNGIMVSQADWAQPKP
jgi:hypothetical protein